MGRRRKQSSSPAPTVAASAPSVPSQKARRAYLYVGVAYLIWVGGFWLARHLAAGSVGALCGGGCSNATIAGVPLEFPGMLWMVAVLMARGPMVVWLALVHAGASLTLGATQWLGIVPLCVPCQVAMVLSVMVVGLCLRGREEPLTIHLAQPLLIGVLAVGTVWPFLGGITPLVTPAPANAPSVADTPTAQAALNSGLVEALSIGNPEAPYELMMLTDFNCPVCKRFEDRTLPVLLEKAVFPGKLKIRFLYKSAHGSGGMSYELIAATALAKAGADAADVVRMLRGKNLKSAPQGIALWSDEVVRDRAMALLQDPKLASQWQTLQGEHGRLGGVLRQRYFDGSAATPLFAMFPGGFDPANLPPGDTLYLFKGYQLPGPFLEFAGASTGDDRSDPTASSDNVENK